MPSSGDLKVSVVTVLVLVTSRAALIWSFITTSTPLPTASALPAVSTALYRLIGPSAEIAVDGRIAPTTTTGLLLLTTRFRK
jgi:hypothetical protein